MNEGQPTDLEPAIQAMPNIELQQFTKWLITERYRVQADKLDGLPLPPVGSELMPVDGAAIIKSPTNEDSVLPSYTDPEEVSWRLSVMGQFTGDGKILNVIGSDGRCWAGPDTGNSRVHLKGFNYTEGDFEPVITANHKFTDPGLQKQWETYLNPSPSEATRPAEDSGKPAEPQTQTGTAEGGPDRTTETFDPSPEEEQELADQNWKEIISAKDELKRTRADWIKDDAATGILTAIFKRRQGPLDQSEKRYLSALRSQARQMGYEVGYFEVPTAGSVTAKISKMPKTSSGPGLALEPTESLIPPEKRGIIKNIVLQIKAVYSASEERAFDRILTPGIVAYKDDSPETREAVQKLQDLQKQLSDELNLPEADSFQQAANLRSERASLPLHFYLDRLLETSLEKGRGVSKRLISLEAFNQTVQLLNRMYAQAPEELRNKLQRRIDEFRRGAGLAVLPEGINYTFEALESKILGVDYHDFENLSLERERATNRLVGLISEKETGSLEDFARAFINRNRATSAGLHLYNQSHCLVEENQRKLAEQAGIRITFSDPSKLGSDAVLEEISQPTEEKIETETTLATTPTIKDWQSQLWQMADREFATASTASDEGLSQSYQDFVRRLEAQGVTPDEIAKEEERYGEERKKSTATSSIKENTGLAPALAPVIPVAPYRQEITLGREVIGTSPEGLINGINQILTKSASSEISFSAAPGAVIDYLKTIELPYGAKIKEADTQITGSQLSIEGSVNVPAMGDVNFNATLAPDSRGRLAIISHKVETSFRLRLMKGKIENEIAHLDQKMAEKISQKVDHRWAYAGFHIVGNQLGNQLALDFTKK